MLCLALVEAADPLCRQLVALAADGLLPSSLAHQCSRTSAHAHAHLTGGTLAAVMGLVFSHVLLLEVSPKKHGKEGERKEGREWMAVKRRSENKKRK